MMGLALVLDVQLLPLALERGNKFLALMVGHQSLLALLLVLLLNLHLLDQVVLVLNLVLDLLQVVWRLAVCLLLQVVVLLRCGQLRGYIKNYLKLNLARPRAEFKSSRPQP